MRAVAGRTQPNDLLLDARVQPARRAMGTRTAVLETAGPSAR